jgi:hypothetical protein
VGQSEEGEVGMAENDVASARERFLSRLLIFAKGGFA